MTILYDNFYTYIKVKRISGSLFTNNINENGTDANWENTFDNTIDLKKSFDFIIDGETNIDESNYPEEIRLYSSENNKSNFNDALCRT